MPPGKTAWAEAEASPTSHGVHTLLWKVECELCVGAAEPSSQSCSKLPTAGERPRSPGREPQHWRTPKPRGKPVAGGGVEGDPETPPTTLPRAKTPPRERDGLEVRTCGLGQRAAKQVRRALDPQNRGGAAFVQKAAKITQRDVKIAGGSERETPLVAEGGDLN